jgi:Rho GTPase-activating protein RGD1
MRIHEVIAENRFRFAQRLSDISEELVNLAKHVDKGRKEVWCSPCICFIH